MTMELRKLLLKIMLWSLGFAAFTGVGAVLLQGGELAWRVVGTGLVTAAASGLLISILQLLDRKKTRAAGLLGMGAVVAEFVMALMLIWDVIELLFGLTVEKSVGLTMIFLGLFLAVAMLCLTFISTALTRWACRLGLGLSAVVFIVLMIATWLPGRPFAHDRWGETALTVSVYGAMCALCLVGVGVSDRRWRWAGVGAAVIAAVMWLIHFWVGTSSNLGVVILVSLTCITAVVGHANLAILCPLTIGQRWVLWATIASVMVTAGLIDLIFIDEKFLHLAWGSREMLGRCTGAAGILTGCGTLALVVLAALNRRVDYEPVSRDMLEMTVICPRCATKQSIRVGDEQCKQCGLRIHTRVEEPRCPQCDYLLYKLTSDRCPECGTTVGSRQ